MTHSQLFMQPLNEVKPIKYHKKVTKRENLGAIPHIEK